MTKGSTTGIALLAIALIGCGAGEGEKIKRIGQEYILKSAGDVTGFLYDIALSPDGRTLAVACTRGVEIRDAETLKFQRILEGNMKGTTSTVAFGPDGKFIVAGTWGPLVTAWKVDGWVKVWDGDKHKGKVNEVAISPDGKMVASGSDDGTVRLWEMESGKEVKVIGCNKERVWSVDFSPDGRWLAMGGGGGVNTNMDYHLYVYDLKAMEETAKEIGTNRPTTARFTKDGKYLIVGGGIKRGPDREWVPIDTWSVGDWELVKRVDGAGVGEPLCESSDGRYIVTGDDEGTSTDDDMKVWDKGKWSALCVIGLKDYTMIVQEAVFSVDGKKLYVGDGKGQIIVWDFEKILKDVVKEKSNEGK